MHYLLIQSRECMEFILCSLLTNFSEANWEKYLFLKKKERKERHGEEGGGEGKEERRDEMGSLNQIRDRTQ